MPLIEPNEMTTKIVPQARLIGLDLGTKTIGLAVSDSAFTVASPLQTIRRTKFTADAKQLLGVGGEFCPPDGLQR